MERTVDERLLYNPYDFANPVEDKGVFVGRQAQLSELHYYLDHARLAPRAIHIAILGKRASGKTSLLNMAELSAAQSGFCVVRVNLNESDAQSATTFLLRVYDSIVTAAFKEGLFGGLNSKAHALYLQAISLGVPPDAVDSISLPLVFPAQYAVIAKSASATSYISESLYVADLYAIGKELNKPIAVLMDEAGVLAKSRVQLQCIRNIFMGIRKYVLILVGTPELMTTMDDVFSPIARQFKKISVDGFKDTHETETLIRVPLERANLAPGDFFDFSDTRSIRDIHQLTSGRPYEIQLLCHILFRRVQDRRGPRMQLNYASLEEVRAELETSQDLSARPIVTAVRAMDKERLTALSILTDCLGRATFDQLASIETIIRNLIAYENLKSYLDEFTGCGILAIRQGGTLAFCGDEFDKIYLKYYAREFDIACEFQDLPLERYVLVQMRRHYTVLYNSVYPMLGNPDALPLTEALTKTFVEMASPNSEDLFLNRESLAMAVYWASIGFASQAEIPVFSMRLHLSSFLTSSAIWFFRSPADLADEAAVMSVFKEMQSRAVSTGAECVATRMEMARCPEPTLIEKVLATGNIRARGKIAERHAELMGDAFLNDSAADSLRHAELAFTYIADLPPKARTNVGYVFLTNGRLEAAEKLFALDMTAEFPPTWPALALYDMGVVKALRSDWQEALKQFESCIAELQKLERLTLLCQSLQLLTLQEGKVRIKEVRHDAADLVKLATLARAAMIEVITRQQNG